MQRDRFCERGGGFVVTAERGESLAEMLQRGVSFKVGFVARGAFGEEESLPRRSPFPNKADLACRWRRNGWVDV